MDNLPDVIRIEPVGLCNFNCQHCPTGVAPNKRALLSKDQFHEIINSFKEINFLPRVVVLYHGGESLLNKNLAYFIEYLKKWGVKKTAITTNASLLTEQKSKELIQAGIDQIKCSFDGESPKENNFIRKKGNFYEDAKNLKNFCKIYKKIAKHKIDILTSNIIITQEKDLETIDGSYKNIVKNKKQIPPKYLTDYFEEEKDVMRFSSFPAMVWPNLNKDDYLYKTYPSEQPSYCSLLFETFTILSNGNVVTCCYDLQGELVHGNVFKEKIIDIWQGSKYKKIRDNFRLKKYNSFCKSCNVVTPIYMYKKDNLETFKKQKLKNCHT